MIGNPNNPRRLAFAADQAKATAREHSPWLYNSCCKNGRWVPSIPLKAPIDVRWCCEHHWTPHVYDSGETSFNYFDCLCCGVGIEAGVQPDDGAWSVRKWIAQRIFPYGRATRRHGKC